MHLPIKRRFVRKASCKKVETRLTYEKLTKREKSEMIRQNGQTGDRQEVSPSSTIRSQMLSDFEDVVVTTKCFQEYTVDKYRDAHS